MDSVKNFYEALAKDKAMQERAKELNSKQIESEDDKIATIVEFANKEGYKITAQDVKDYIKESSTIDLSDNALEKVSGGVFCWLAGGKGKCGCFLAILPLYFQLHLLLLISQSFRLPELQQRELLYFRLSLI